MDSEAAQEEQQQRGQQAAEQPADREFAPVGEQQRVRGQQEEQQAADSGGAQEGEKQRKAVCRFREADESVGGWVLCTRLLSVRTVRMHVSAARV